MTLGTFPANCSKLHPAKSAVHSRKKVIRDEKSAMIGGRSINREPRCGAECRAFASRFQGAPATQAADESGLVSSVYQEGQGINARRFIANVSVGLKVK